MRPCAAIGITDPADGAGTVLAAFETLRVLPPAIESSRVRVVTGCGL